MIVRFTRRCIRDSVFYSKKELRDYNQANVAKIYINEDFAPSTRTLFNKAREKLRAKLIAGVWTSHCRVTIKFVNGSIKTVIVTVTLLMNCLNVIEIELQMAVSRTKVCCFTCNKSVRSNQRAICYDVCNE